MDFCFYNPKILTLLSSALENCPCGKTHTLETKGCIIAEDALARLEHFIGDYAHPAIFCDENTAAYAREMGFCRDADLLVFPGNAHATEVMTALGDTFLSERKPDILVACGSGSLHDITRYCANDAHLPFVSYPTAASVDGFMSGISAMTWYGQKKSFASTPPIAVFADPRISTAAPVRLIASGVGDVLGKYVSLFDWHLAHLLIDEYECPTIVALTEAAVEGVLDALQNKDTISALDYTGRVLDALLVSGLAMQLMGNSRPASAAEHHMAHLWEMAIFNEKTTTLHGEAVAVGTMTALETYRAALDAGLDWDTIGALDFDKIFDKDTLQPALGDLTKNFIEESMPDGTPASCSLSKLHAANMNTGEVEEKIKALFAALPDVDTLRALAKKAGCMTTRAEAGLPTDEEFLETTLRYAPYVRNRLTLLKILSACKMTKGE